MCIYSSIISKNEFISRRLTSIEIDIRDVSIKCIILIIFQTIAQTKIVGFEELDSTRSTEQSRIRIVLQQIFTALILPSVNTC